MTFNSSNSSSGSNENSSNINWILKKYPNLPNSSEVRKSIESARRNGEKIPGKLKPAEKIEYFQNRVARIMEARPELLKNFAIQKTVSSERQIANSGIYEWEQQAVFDRTGQWVHINQDFIDAKNQEIIRGQTDSFKPWIDYLNGPDALYPDHLKYWAITEVKKLGNLKAEEIKDKNGEVLRDEHGNTKKKRWFPSRNEKTMSPYPEMNPGAIARVFSAVEKYQKGEIENYSKHSQEEFEESLKKADFKTLYLWSLESLGEFDESELQITDGKWVKYNHGSNAKELFDSLQGFNCPWCTSNNFSTAQSQLEVGDFYVYYSKNKGGEAIKPRIAIRIEDNQIAEVRGIKPDQDMDDYITPVLDEKLKEFGEKGKEYLKKSANLREVKRLFAKSFANYDPTTGKGLYLNPAYTEEEIIFLLSDPATFGYRNDGRIKKMLEEMHKLSKETAINIINKGGAPGVARNLEKFLELDKEVAMLLIEKCGADGVADNLEKFSGLDKEVALHLIENGKARTVANNLEKFEGLQRDKSLAMLLIEKGGADAVADNLEKFEGLQKDASLAMLLIEKGGAPGVARNLEKFLELDKEVAMLLIEKCGAYEVARNLEKFLELDKEVALHLIENGKAWLVARNLEKFSGLDANKEFAMLLIEKGDGGAVANNLDKFSGLDKEIYDELMEEGYKILT